MANLCLAVTKLLGASSSKFMVRNTMCYKYLTLVIYNSYYMVYILTVNILIYIANKFTEQPRPYVS